MPGDGSREVRFGLVLYGGVSLAIYINGVTFEFTRAVRGSGVYKLIAALTDSDFIVDILSGSSAGGINGIFFSYALANRRDFGSMASLWCEMGDIERLLHPADVKPEAAKSLLRSETFYEPQLLNALRNMAAYHGPPDEQPIPTDLDLFVTGTNVEGDIYTIFDDQGHLVDVKDHRTVFRVQNRPDEAAESARRDFSQENSPDALARLARITSAFPAAFSPVHVADGTPVDAGTAADTHLRDWGNFVRSSNFMDGGVLNNKPFTHTIAAICRRRPGKPHQRILCYVEPDPERFTPQASPVLPPQFLAAALDGTLGIKSYESIADDLKRIFEHNANVERYWQVCGDLRRDADGTRLTWIGRGVFPDEHCPEPQKTVYVRARFAAMGRRAMQGIMRDPQGRNRRYQDERTRTRASMLVRQLIDLPAVDDVLSDAESLTRFDIYFRLRRLRQVVYRAIAAVPDADTAQTAAAYRDLIGRLNHRIHVLEIIRAAMETVMDRAPVNWENPNRSARDIWGDVRWYLELLLNRATMPALPPTPAGREQFYQQMQIRVNTVIGTHRNNAAFSDPFEGILAITDAAELAEFPNNRPPWLTTLFEEYDQFISLDLVVYPIEYVCGLEAKDAIHLLRISPGDSPAPFGARTVEEKLAGLGLAHFSGFLKRSWRSNDIMWGRLDSVGEIVKATLKPERLQHILSHPYLVDKLRARFTGPGALRAATVLPHSPASAATIDGWIARLLDPVTRAAAIAELDTMRDLLIQMAQLEILYESVPAVIEDAAHQQLEWNRLPEQQQAAAVQPAAAFRPGGAWVDPHVASVAAVQLSREYSASLAYNPPAPAPVQDALAVDFQSYRIAEEGLQGIPQIVVIEWLARAALVLKSCILGSLPEDRRKSVEAHPLYRLIDWPLRLAHWFADLWRRSPASKIVTIAVLFSISLVVLVFTLWTRQVVLWDGDHFRWKSFLLLVALPLAILYAMVQASKLRSLLRIVVSGILVLLGAAAAMAVWFCVIDVLNQWLSRL